jgi:hypothetical protein
LRQPKLIFIIPTALIGGVLLGRIVMKVILLYFLVAQRKIRTGSAATGRV